MLRIINIVNGESELEKVGKLTSGNIGNYNCQKDAHDQVKKRPHDISEYIKASYAILHTYQLKNC